MPKCKSCSKRGLFLITNDAEVCEQCEFIIAMEVEQRLSLIESSVEIIENTNRLETAHYRIQDIMSALEALRTFEVAGTYEFRELPSVTMKKMLSTAGFVLLKIAEKELLSATTKSQAAATLRSKVNPLIKLKIKLEGYRSDPIIGSKFDSLVREIDSRVWQASYDDLRVKAEKYEFKKNNKKALESYYDLLYFLRKDDIPDSEQRAEIGLAEGKIRELGGELK